MSNIEFEEFPKIARLSRECVITEKIDGTNAQIWISDDSTIIQAGSRNRWLSPDADNFGFHKWVFEHAEELLKLGPGRHFGEWWGQGIQRGYGLTEKRFSLFNTTRWCAHKAEPKPIKNGDPKAPVKMQERAPACCHLVPEMYRGVFKTDYVEDCLANLFHHGSNAAPGFMNPEGVVIYHAAAGIGFKKTIHKDEVPKGQQ
jgi:hypothetical protein